jgi:transcriptional regulator with XRE-family HTH domain
MKVSDQIRRITEQCGESRYAIAKATGIAESALSRFLAGKRGLSSNSLDKLGEHLGLEVVVKTRKAR